VDALTGAMPEAISEPRRSYPRHGVHGRLVEAIGRLIIGGGLAAGAVLPREVELMDEFGSSRAAVREAVKVLAAKGLVETRQRRGMRIRALEEWNLLDPDVLAWCAASGPAPLLMAQMVELRCLIEPRAARLAAGRRTAAELEALEAAHAQMVATFADAVAYNLADLAFHRAVFRACGNPFVDRLGAIVAVVLEGGFRLRDGGMVPIEAGLVAHGRVLAAIRDGEAAAAEAAMLAVIEVARLELPPVDDGPC
jgi:DNA-binding FadR family transcriptional regulator